LFVLAGVVRAGGYDAGDPVTVKLHPSCPHHDPQDDTAPCMQVRFRYAAAIVVWPLQQ
jgi:hypothetical protein